MKKAGLRKKWPKFLILAGLGSQFAAAGWAQSLSGRPVKIEVLSESSAVTAGASARLRVNLLDPENRPANTGKDLNVQVEGRLPSGETETSTVVIKAGENGGTAQLPAKEPGPLKLVASNRELASGGMILNVRTVQQEMPMSSATPRASASPWFAPPLPSAAPSASPSVSTEPHFHAESYTRSARIPSATTAARARAAAEVASSPAPLSWNPALAFLYVPERKIWADKKDAATVYANLPPDEVAPWDMPHLCHEYRWLVRTRANRHPQGRKQR